MTRLRAMRSARRIDIPDYYLNPIASGLVRHLAKAVEHGSRNLEISIHSRAQRDLRLGFAVKIGPAGYSQTVFTGERGVARDIRGPMIGMINLNAAQSRLLHFADQHVFANGISNAQPDRVRQHRQPAGGSYLFDARGNGR